MAAIGLQHKRSTEGMTEDMWLREFERLCQSDEAVCVFGHPKRLWRICRLATPRGVPRHHRELLRKVIDLTLPNPAVAQRSMHQDEGRPLPRSGEGDLKAVYVNSVHLLVATS
jgi:hypothetical protein